MEYLLVRDNAQDVLGVVQNDKQLPQRLTSLLMVATQAERSDISTNIKGPMYIESGQSIFQTCRVNHADFDVSFTLVDVF